MRKSSWMTALLLVALVGCAGAGEIDDDVALGGLEEELTAAEAARAKALLVGSLEEGVESAVVRYTPVPRYRAFKFAGEAGEVVRLSVRSPDGGVAMAWVIDDSFAGVADQSGGRLVDGEVLVTLPGNANPDVHTYYVVFRERDLRRKHFTALLTRESCKKDVECEGLEVPAGSDDVPLCNVDTGRCELVDVLDVRCGGRSLNPHECPDGYECVGAGLARDIPGFCRLPCEADAECAAGEVCVEGGCEKQ